MINECLHKRVKALHDMALATGWRGLDLIEIRISEVDFAAGLIRTNDPNRPQIKIDGDVRELLETAIDGRTEGFVFVTQKGKPWKRSNLNDTFRSARQSAGVSDEVII